jgi:hypothetical protein
VDHLFWFVSWHGWMRNLQGQLDLSKFWVELCFWLIFWILHLLGFMVKIGFYMQLVGTHDLWTLWSPSVSLNHIYFEEALCFKQLHVVNVAFRGAI